MKSDIVIIGAGIVGVTIALELKKRFSNQKIVIIEKESQAGYHASGRNSGVLHAGFYYTADSLKARFCRDGNHAMKNYCREHKLKINTCGKLVVTKNELELKTLHALYERGLQNKVNVILISEKEAKEIEPRVRTYQQAIFSPETASVDPTAVMQTLVKEAENRGITFLYCEKYIRYLPTEKSILTNQRKIHAGFIINAAGLYADQIAKQFGFGLHYDIIPFKGLYLYSDEKPSYLKTHLYPVPDLHYPFLGVHFTITVDHQMKMGPTAIPAFWREQYAGWSGFSFSECCKILAVETKLFIKNQGHFRAVALAELKKYRRHILVQQAASMLDQVNLGRFNIWGKPGIRAQLIDKKSNRLVNDFCFEGDARSFHVLNAVSPAFTCSFPFATYLVDQMAVV